jgi:hypothetical protein
VVAVKYRVTRIQELLNPAFTPLLNGATKEERAVQALEPEHLYEVDLVVEGDHCGGSLALQFRYVPMLEVGAVYTMKELDEV